jgi:hypothetical protein
VTWSPNKLWRPTSIFNLWLQRSNTCATIQGGGYKTLYQSSEYPWLRLTRDTPAWATHNPECDALITARVLLLYEDLCIQTVVSSITGLDRSTIEHHYNTNLYQDILFSPQTATQPYFKTMAALPRTTCPHHDDGCTSCDTPLVSVQVTNHMQSHLNSESPGCDTPRFNT